MSLFAFGTLNYVILAVYLVALTKTKILAASSTILGLFAGPILALFLL